MACKRFSFILLPEALSKELNVWASVNNSDRVRMVVREGAVIRGSGVIVLGGHCVGYQAKTFCAAEFTANSFERCPGRYIRRGRLKRALGLRYLPSDVS